jgi:RNA polymerase sigma-70 factor (ECF subfamily)
MDAPMEAPTDERLIKSTLSGDDEAFAELVRRHKQKVFRIVARFVRSDYELDDICQEIFIKVYQNLKKYRGDAPFEHWLTRIAINASYDKLRKQRREGNSVPLEDVTLSQRDPTPEETFSGEEAWKILKHAVANLRPEDRLVITLLNLEEKSVREISALTGWSEAKVKVRAFRARKELKRILEDKNGNRFK